jgi:hypothetical protein
MNTRYSDSLINDPNLSIMISLTGVLIFNQTNDTPWTETVSNKLECNPSLEKFASSMNNSKLPFDHAVAIVKFIFKLNFNS